MRSNQNRRCGVDAGYLGKELWLREGGGGDVTAGFDADGGLGLCLEWKRCLLGDLASNCGKLEMGFGDVRRGSFFWLGFQWPLASAPHSAPGLSGGLLSA